MNLWRKKYLRQWGCARRVSCRQQLGFRELRRPRKLICPRARRRDRARDAFCVAAVHDPRARQMGGVAGHAGLFSTADDLALFCKMMLAGGVAPNGKRIFAAATVRLMTSPQQAPWIPSVRGLGWDIDSAYSAPRGDLFPIGSYGMTGFTGTEVWIDPASQTFILFLTNSVHPYGRPAISSLRGQDFHDCRRKTWRCGFFRRRGFDCFARHRRGRAAL